MSYRPRVDDPPDSTRKWKLWPYIYSYKSVSCRAHHAVDGLLMGGGDLQGARRP